MSFRGKIAVPLEAQLNSILNNNTTFSADIVECGGFVVSASFILAIAIGMTDEVKAFQKKYKNYVGLTYNEIPLSIAEEIYSEYTTLLNHK